MNILITGGGTEEPIDNVRSICNFSTGTTAATLADNFCKKENNVLCLMSERGIKPSKAKYLTFRTFSDLQMLLRDVLLNNHFDLVVHAAAVSDFSIDKIFIDGKPVKKNSICKIPSDKKVMISLKNNPKLIDSIKKIASDSMLVGFKLTDHASDDERLCAVQKLFYNGKRIKKNAPDFVVSNDKSEITADRHPCVIYNNELLQVAKCDSVKKLSDLILKLTKRG